MTIQKMSLPACRRFHRVGNAPFVYVSAAHGVLLRVGELFSITPRAYFVRAAGISWLSWSHPTENAIFLFTKIPRPGSTILS